MSPTSLCCGRPNCSCLNLRSRDFFQLRWTNRINEWHLANERCTRSMFRPSLMAKSRMCPKQLIRKRSNSLNAGTTFEPLSVVVATKPLVLIPQLSSIGYVLPSVISKQSYSVQAKQTQIPTVIDSEK